MLISDPDGKIISCNHAFEVLTGYLEEEFFGQNCKILQGPGTCPRTISAISEAIKNQKEFIGEILNYRKSGERWWNDLAITPLFGDDGTLQNFIGVTRDVTDRKLAEEKLQIIESENRFILENVQAGIVLHKADTEIVYANPAARRILGLDAGEIIGRTNDDPQWSLVDKDGAPLAPCDLPVNRAVSEKVEIRDVIVGNMTVDRDQRWLLCNAFPVNKEGVVAEVLVSFTNISPLVQAEEQAKLDQERFRLAAKATQDVIFDIDLETQRFWANDSYKKIFGDAPPDDIQWHGESKINVIEEDRKKLRETTLSAVHSPDDTYSVEYRFRKTDGSLGFALTHGYILRSPEGKAKRIIGNTKDLTNTLATMNALKEAEIRFRIIADTVSDVLWDHNFDTGETWSTPGWADRLGVMIDKSKAQTDRWLENLDPADRERVNRSFIAALKSDATEWKAEYGLIGSDGERIDLAVKAAILRHPDGSAYRILGNARNVTIEKRQHEGFTRSRALEAVGQLTGGVAHDFNNQLMIIQGNAELLGMSELDEDQAESVALINLACSSAADLTQRLLSFSRQSHLKTGNIDLAKLIPNTVALLRAGIPETITIQCKVPADIWRAKADANALEQAIVNLAVNSRDAMPQGGDIVIGCENRKISRNMGPDSPELEPGDDVAVSVTDNGEGMPPEVLAKVFEPFFTTKDVGKGTGLGLSTVYGFAKQSDGKVTIYSEPGKGTSVNLYLPRFKEAEEEDVSEPMAVAAEAETGQRILLVEDQPEVRAHVEKLLIRMGYVVIAAADGKEALAVMCRGYEFDLLFTDVILPGGTNGQQLAEEVRKIDPRVKVLFTSGYPAFAFEHLNLEELDNLKLLRKPYRSADLKAALADLLGK